MEKNIDVSEAGDLTDNRKRYDWKSRYPEQAVKEIRLEGVYLFLTLIFSLVFIFGTWRSWFCLFCSLSPVETVLFKKYLYYSSSGMLGGIIFGMKYFYRVVARGYWHQDRKAWRLMSPYIAMAIAVVVGWLVDASMIKNQSLMGSAAVLSIGFLSGYFADEAVSKMYEIAAVVFGKRSVLKDEEVK